MFLDDIISKDGIIQEMDRICGSTDANYPYRDKVARINSALDRYFELAFKSGKQWNFDDIKQSSPPIDTQNIVSGTNRYKFSAFSEKILSVLRLEVLNSAGSGLFLIPETFDDMYLQNPGNQSGKLSSINANTFQDLYLNPATGTPTHYIKYGDFVYLRPSPDYSLADALKVYFDRTLARHTFARFTVTIANPGVFTATAHGLAVNDTVVIKTNGTLPTGLTDGTTYYVATAPTADTFTVATTLGGSGLETTGTQSGVHTFLKTNTEPGVPAIHHDYLARHASLKWLGDKVKPQWNTTKSEIQENETEIIKYFSDRSKDIPRRFTPLKQNNK